jgi:uncharacterized protein
MQRMLRAIFGSTVLLVFLISTADTWALPIVGGKESITVSGNMPYLHVHDTAKVVLQQGAQVAYLAAADNAEVIIEAGAEVVYLTASHHTVLRIVGGTIGFLTMEGNSQTYIHHVTLKGDAHVGMLLGGETITYTPDTKIHIHADNVAFDKGKLTGTWASGERFSLWVVEHNGARESEPYQRPQAFPPQVLAYELAGPSFDCARAVVTVEQTICADAALARLDKRLAFVYKQLLASSPNPNAVRTGQQRWLSDVRNRCPDVACLTEAYSRRLHEMQTTTKGMTNDKARAICTAVVEAVNDGSIARRFLSFEAASEEDNRAWKDANPESLYHVSGVLKVDYHSDGTVDTLGLIEGGGTCGNCNIVDIAAQETELYPPDDEHERFRWAGWGQCDHFVFVDGEPIIVTGNFGWGISRATLISWLAHDGAKRALCYLGPAGNLRIQTVRDEEPALCQAIATHRVEFLPWSEPVSVSQKQLDAAGIRADSSKAAVLDIDLDGKKDTVALLDYASGAGCGSYRQWLVDVTPDKDASTKMLLNSVLAMQEWGPVKGAVERDPWFSVKLLQHQGKPYILRQGTDTSAELVSLWSRQVRTWCEYELLPQHRIEVLYPVETWPTRVE